MPAVLVADREADQEVVERLEPGGRELGGAAIADALERGERTGEPGARSSLGVGRPAHCTTIACPGSTWISRMAAGSANGSSSATPCGWSALFE